MVPEIQEVVLDSYNKVKQLYVGRRTHERMLFGHLTP